MAVLQAFPSVTDQEFCEACRALELRGLDRISGTDWLSVKWTGKELLIKQQRPSESRHHQNPSEAEESDQSEELIEDAVEDSTVQDTVRDFGHRSKFLVLKVSSSLQTIQAPGPSLSTSPLPCPQRIVFQSSGSRVRMASTRRC